MIREEIIIIQAQHGYIEALNKMIEKQDKTIKALKQEPCEDAISRQAVLSKIKEVCFSEEWVQFRVDKGSNGQRDFLINYIEQLSPVTPQTRKGHWVNGEYCSECGCDVPTFIVDWRWQEEKDMDAKYCPNCGSKMEQEG